VVLPVFYVVVLGRDDETSAADGADPRKTTGK
jgi:hypothetical protein